MTTEGRAARSAEADALCRQVYAEAGGPDAGAALVAVGGYGRGELAPFSDLDVVLVHDDHVELGELAQLIWYPLWDARAALDHAVRSFSETAEQAARDVRVALGLLDVRHLAGDPHLTLRLRAMVLADWRRQARSRLPELQKLTRERHERMGELAHESIPDLKESEGGLRDATVLRALVATWLVDAPHVELERARVALLDVRDELHDAAGRGTDRVAPELWPDLAERLRLPDTLAAQRFVRERGRRIAHLSHLTWRRVDGVLARPAFVTGPRRPAMEPVAPGLALSAGELVLDSGARPAHDPLLLLRAAAEAAERDVVLSPATAARLVRDCPPLPDPWPDEARQLLVRLLAAGPGLRTVWETLEETSALGVILPEWDRIALLPHASVIHRHTVDRHVVETCVAAGSLIRSVARPDVLVVAALLHDIGKGGSGDHSVEGEPIARAVARRLGFDDEAVDAVATLVRRHLLLSETATSRDPSDPATVSAVARLLPKTELVDLLLALTEADARATAPKAWSAWRAGLVRELASNVRAVVAGEGHPAAAPAALPLPTDGLALTVTAGPAGSRVAVVAPDRLGLLGDVAAMLALQRASVRACRAWEQDGPDGTSWGASVWDVDADGLDPAVLRQRFAGIAEGRIDAGTRLSRAGRADGLAPSVVVRPDASAASTVLEVRAADRPGLLFLVLTALAQLDLSVASAHVETLGPQAVDVFYVREPGAGALSDSRGAAAAHAVRAALAGD